LLREDWPFWLAISNPSRYSHAQHREDYRPGGRRHAAKTPSSPAKVAPERSELADAAAAYAGASRAENTKRAYTNDFVTFSAWCGERGVPSMPALPGSVALYLTSLAIAEKKVATIERALVAISQAHPTASPPRGRRRR
jgi:hypothetical protein